MRVDALRVRQVAYKLVTMARTSPLRDQRSVSRRHRARMNVSFAPGFYAPEVLPAFSQCSIPSASPSLDQNPSLASSHFHSTARPSSLIPPSAFLRFPYPGVPRCNCQRRQYLFRQPVLSRAAFPIFLWSATVRLFSLTRDFLRSLVRAVFQRPCASGAPTMPIQPLVQKR